MKDCSRAPLAGEPVEIWFANTWTGDSEPFAGVIGEGKTDVDGRFFIRCKRYSGDGSLVVQAQGVVGMCWKGELPRSESLELGVAFQKPEVGVSPEFGVSLHIKTDGRFRTNDTLFFCYDEREGPHMVYPITADQVVPFSTTWIHGGTYLGDRDQVHASLLWAIGRADYEALNANRQLSRPYYPGWQSVPLRRCSTADTFTVHATGL